MAPSRLTSAKFVLAHWEKQVQDFGKKACAALRLASPKAQGSGTELLEGLGVFAVTTSTSEVPQDPAAPSGRPKIALRGAKAGTTPGPPLPSRASEASEEISPRTKDEGGPALTIVLIVFIVVGAALTALMLAKVCAHRKRSDRALDACRKAIKSTSLSLSVYTTHKTMILGMN
ncbi:unnamed protein product [Cladocopium goreaui]|uniref:Uncharacterized protein n=1 Tax=Cladocopium goreaui TaxID=2562237 RepID=A0A9P1DVR5_9DINO|nr:unnamed protein product [Cladocopium goreaui]